MILRRIVFAFGGLLVFVLHCIGQTSTSQISGTVLDAIGAAVPGATITLTSEVTGIAQKQTSTASGVYAFPAIPVGSYSVKVEAAGFKTAVKVGNTVEVNTPLVVDMRMEVGGRHRDGAG